MSTQHVNTTGIGAGSCAAFPFRADSLDLDHDGGCPRWAECCTEFGYCHGKVDNGHNIRYQSGTGIRLITGLASTKHL